MAKRTPAQRLDLVAAELAQLEDWLAERPPADAERYVRMAWSRRVNRAIARIPILLRSVERAGADPLDVAAVSLRYGQVFARKRESEGRM